MLSFKGSTFTLDQFKKKLNKFEHTEIVKIIEDLIEKNEITPIKNSILTPNYPPIHTKYRIIKKEKNDDKILKEISKLYISFSTSFYKNNVEEYKKHRSYIKKLTNYLLSNNNNLKNKVSVNERSYEIFLDEKFLLSEEGEKMAKYLAIDIYSLLNVYSTPEPFIYMPLSKKSPQNILIVENKDIYISLMMHLSEGNKTILNKEISTLIYGEGYKIQSSFTYLNKDITLNYLNHKDNTFYYFGDLDKEGFAIYAGFKNKYPEYNIKIFTEGYEKMLSLSENIELGNIKNEQKEYYEEYIDDIPTELKERIKSILYINKYIPQEVITKYDL